MVAMFLAFAGGVHPKDIAREYGISEGEFARLVKDNNWRGLALRLPKDLKEQIEAGSEREVAVLDRLRENRNKNFELADRLRRDAEKCIALMEQGKLTVTEYKQSKSGPVECERDLTPKDRLDFAKYVQTIADMTYRALGDEEATSDGKPEGKEGKGLPKAIGMIQINLPGIAKKPRKVIDVD